MKYILIFFGGVWMGKGNHFGKEQGFGLLKLFLPLEVATNQTSTDRVYKQTGFCAFPHSPPPNMLNGWL